MSGTPTYLFGLLKKANRVASLQSQVENKLVAVKVGVYRTVYKLVQRLQTEALEILE